MGFHLILSRSLSLLKALRVQTVTSNARLLQNQKGYSIPEMIIASALVIMGVLGVSSSVYDLGKSSSKNRMVSSAFAIETIIVSATQNSEYFRVNHPVGSPGQTLASVLSTGAVPQMQIVDDSGVVVADTGADKTFDNEGRPCTGYPSRTCTIKVSFSLKNLATPGNSPDHRFAYFIEFAGVKDVVSTQPMGQRSGGSSFANQDYQTPINYMFYERSNQIEGCVPGNQNSFVITGMDRDTGNVTCAKYPSNSLGPGEISKGISYNSTLNELQVKGVTAKKYTCPQNYILAGVNMKDLEPGATVGAPPKCRFVGPASYSVTLSQIPPHGGSAIPCAPFYEISSASCTGNASVATPGACNPSTRPAWNGSSVYQVPNNPTPRLGLNSGYTISQSVDASKKRLDCAVTYLDQQCGLTIQANVSFSATCTRMAGIPDEINATLQ